jgi:hypothetical protein
MKKRGSRGHHGPRPPRDGEKKWFLWFEICV